MQFQNAEFLASYGLVSQMPESEKCEIAFAGRSNVGKSSLINKIFGRKSLARVSSVPGKTATINFYGLDDLLFVDLPGYGYARVQKSEKQRFSKLIEGYFEADRNLALLFLLIDMRHPPAKLDVAMVEYLIDMEMPFVIVLTKADKLSQKQQSDRLEALLDELPCAGSITMIPASAQTGQGIEDIRKILEEISGDEAKS